MDSSVMLSIMSFIIISFLSSLCLEVVYPLLYELIVSLPNFPRELSYQNKTNFSQQTSDGFYSLAYRYITSGNSFEDFRL